MLPHTPKEHNPLEGLVELFSNNVCEIGASPAFIQEAKGQPSSRVSCVSWGVRKGRSCSLYFLPNSVQASLIQIRCTAPHCSALKCLLSPQEGNWLIKTACLTSKDQ